MYYDETLRRIKFIDQLIRIKGTGTAEKLAQRLGVSRATVYVYLNIMKENGAPIKFCKFRQSYFYDEEGSFAICFLKKNEVSSQLMTA